MVDTVDDWDSLWNRTTRNIDISKISDRKEFIQTMLTQFFTGKYNPKGWSIGKMRLTEELWERYAKHEISKRVYLTIPSTLKDRLREKGIEWKPDFSYRIEVWKGRKAGRYGVIRDLKGRFITYAKL